MIIGIIRAGPWASFTNSFLPQPDLLTDTALPVNCANYYADFWPWICLSRYDDALVGVDYEIEPAVDGIVSVQKEARLWRWKYTELVLMWRYQAMNQYTLTVSYFAGFVDLATISATFWVDERVVFADNQNNVLFMGGTESITLPPATVPKRVLLRLFAGNAPFAENSGIFQFSFDLAPLP